MLRRTLFTALASVLLAGTALAAPVVVDPNFNQTNTFSPYYYGIVGWGADNSPPSPTYAGNPSFAGSVGFDPSNQWNNGSLASGETKWLRMSGLTLLLPHGYEGQGPEHSSARLERYLQLCAERNMTVCNLTTPANYFHALRRQLKRNFRKPLVIMTPKSLLRHKLAVSPLADMAEGSRFRFVIPETDKLAAPERVKRVVVCTGKVYYDLLAERRDKGVDDVAIIRLEQIFPFPERTLGAVLQPYANAEVVWCQEEPANMGAWSFVDRRIEKVLAGNGGRATRPIYAGRVDAASPATGLAKIHAAEQMALVRDALGMNA